MNSPEMRQLAKSWSNGDFPHHLNRLEINGIRGWKGESITFDFPVCAIVGENGAGKTSILQAAGVCYKGKSKNESFFASQFFPDTAWEKIENAYIKGDAKKGDTIEHISVRKPTSSWRGNPNRPERPVYIIDLRRTAPIYALPGYAQLANKKVQEKSQTDLGPDFISRASHIIGRQYAGAKVSTTNVDSKKSVPILSTTNESYSGFHQGAGEAVIADLLARDIPNYALVVIDEVETSLHPRAQRRLVRDLARLSREKKIQFIFTTHSPYVLEELPSQARIYISQTSDGKNVDIGPSPEYALSEMDESTYPEYEVYVEDKEAKSLTSAILRQHAPHAMRRLTITSYGSAQVGKSLGQMVKGDRFRIPTTVLLDSDQEAADGCHLLPGKDAPELVIFYYLESDNWKEVASRLDCSYSRLYDAAQRELATPHYKQYINNVADEVMVSGDMLWEIMCSVFAKKHISWQDVKDWVEPIIDNLEEER
ncbi:ATP-dependent nuclease [Halomonadaceae bacterium KBTZ08]